MSQQNLPSFLKQGAKPSEAKKDSPYVALKDGSMFNIVPLQGLDEVISFDQHVIWLDEGSSPMFPCLKSKDCPGCQIGDKPRFRAVVPVLVKNDEGKTEPGQKILPMGIDMFRQMTDIGQVTGTIKGKVIRVSRKGAGFNTKYSAIFTGQQIKNTPTVDINVVEHLGPLTRDEIIEELVKVDKWPPKGAKGEKANEPSVKSDNADLNQATDDWEATEFESEE